MEIHHEKIPIEFNVRIMTDFSRAVPHWHQHGEMLYILTGKFSINIGSEQYTGMPGDAFVINSGHIHDIQPIIPESTLYVTTYTPAPSIIPSTGPPGIPPPLIGTSKKYRLCEHGSKRIKKWQPAGTPQGSADRCHIGFLLISALPPTR